MRFFGDCKSTGSHMTACCGSDPRCAVEMANALHGPSAITAVAWLALAARCEGSEEDFRFWVRVFREMNDGAPKEAAC